MGTRRRRCLAPYWITVLIGVGLGWGGSLESGFLRPPDEARPWVYYFIMDGNLSREGITADFEAMQKAGLGGMILMEVDAGIPKGSVKFMSEPWREIFKHAVAEAQRLGLQITLNAGPGWTGSGGPWVKPEQSMQHLVASETIASGPTRFDAALPQPIPRKPFFGEGGLPAELDKACKEFYRDVAVLAFPTPKEKAVIEDVDEKALYFRAPYSSQPGVKPFIASKAEYPTLGNDQRIPIDGIIDLTSRLSPDGRLVWDVPEGNWTILRFGRTSTGQNTRPAPEAGLGLESDKFDAAALDAHFEAFVGPLLAAVGTPNRNGAGWTSLHIDSWEMSSQNWTARFRQEFQRRRGYDPLRYLPAMTGRVVESVELSERFLWDLRKTAQELVLENHAAHLRRLGSQHGLGLSIEPYDMNPAGDLSLGAAAEVPMCEFWAGGYGFQTEFSCFEAVSIAHTNGRPIVAAESFTSDDRERWQLYPGAIKSQGDWALCTGINRIVFHRYQHQPQPDRRPGMTMGPYGVHWERTQTWWDMAGAYHEYLARCQWMLRQGKPVVDICLLAPEGAPHVFRAPKSATRGNPPDRLGYSFDGCAPETLIERMSAKDGWLMLPDGMSYRLLVLPAVETMTPALLTKIRQLVEDGATVIGSPPRKSPSLSGYPACDAQIQKMAGEIWGNTGSPMELTERRFGKGRIVWGGGIGSNTESELYPEYQQLADVLTKMGVVPDFESDIPLRYIHRRDGDTELYFVSNPQNQQVSATAVFRVSGKRPQLWDPVTTERRLPQEFAEQNGRLMVPLEFAPNQSFFVIFRNSSDKTQKAGVNFPRWTQLSKIAGPWEIRFEPNRGAPQRATFDTLIDWTKHADPGIRHFSGVATYTAQFEWNPPSDAAAKRPVFLDLGRIEVMAQVTLNGRDLGVVWTPPLRVDASAAIKPGANTLQIRVANLWPNRLIADSALPPDQRITSTTWNPFAKETPLLPSGLLGPVSLLGRE